MKKLQTNCPACGGPVIFQAGWALVTVCEFCESAIGRTDRDVKDLGKVAEVGDPASGLRRGVEGRWRGKRFRLAGRVRYRHSGGGSWDEWYLDFPGGRCGWLAEAQGKFWLTHRRKLASDARLPKFDELDLGESVTLKGTPLTAREKGVATAESAEGEIPWAFQPGAEHHYIDLHGPDRSVATFDYGQGTADDDQAAFLGFEVTLSDLGIDAEELAGEREATRVSAAQLNCPHCGGPLELRAPDESLRVACPSCTSMLDVREGKLSLFQSLHQDKVKPLIPLGSKGDFSGMTYTVIGFMERYAKYAGRIYPWTEYLMYNPDTGFRWLVNNDRHWSLVAAVDQPPSSLGDRAVYKGTTFRIYDRGIAYVRYVLGEFYWKVTIGEKASTADYIAPPRMLSVERSGFGRSQEVNVSEGVYIRPEELEQIFGIENLPRAWGVGVIQPSPKPSPWFWVLWLGFLGFLAMIFTVVGRGRADGWLFFYALIGVSLIPALTLGYLYNFEVQRWRDSDYSPYASDD